MKSDAGAVSLLGDRHGGRRGVVHRLVLHGRRLVWGRLRTGWSRWTTRVYLDDVLDRFPPVSFEEPPAGPDDEIVERWWSELPHGDRDRVLRLRVGDPLPEEHVVGLLVTGLTLPTRLSRRSVVEQPEAVQHLLRREQDRRRRTGTLEVQPDREALQPKD